MTTEVQRAANLLEGKGYLIERIHDGPDYSFVTFVDKEVLRQEWGGPLVFGKVAFLAKEIHRARLERTQGHLVQMRTRQAELRLLHDIGKTKIKEVQALKRLGVSTALTLLAVYPLVGRIF